MKIKYLDNSDNSAGLTIKEISSTNIEIEHFNYDDGNYHYLFSVKGTEEEIKVIKEFCKEIDCCSSKGENND